MGESLASEYLLGKGYQMLKRNFRTRFGEIDIVADKDGVTVFVEVKTKVGEDFGSPEEMINRRKINQVKKMAIVYLEGKETKCRLDAIAVVLNKEGKVTRLTHYENVG